MSTLKLATIAIFTPLSITCTNIHISTTPIKTGVGKIVSITNYNPNLLFAFGERGLLIKAEKHWGFKDFYRLKLDIIKTSRKNLNNYKGAPTDKSAIVIKTVDGRIFKHTVFLGGGGWDGVDSKGNYFGGDWCSWEYFERTSPKDLFQNIQSIVVIDKDEFAHELKVSPCDKPDWCHNKMEAISYGDRWRIELKGENGCKLKMLGGVTDFSSDHISFMPIEEDSVVVLIDHSNCIEAKMVKVQW